VSETAHKRPNPVAISNNNNNNLHNNTNHRTLATAQVHQMVLIHTNPAMGDNQAAAAHPTALAETIAKTKAVVAAVAVVVAVVTTTMAETVTQIGVLLTPKAPDPSTS
jgi:hypothetical protein